MGQLDRRRRRRLGGRNAAVAMSLGLVLEAAPMAVAAIVGRPIGVVVTGLGFVIAWAAVAGARQPDGALDPGRGLRAVWTLLGRLVAFYGVVVAAAGGFLLATAFLVGLWFRDLLAGTVVVALTLTLLARFAYVVPCLVDGDDLVVALERSFLLAGSRGLRGLGAILALAAAALGPPIVVAELAGTSGPGAVVAILLALAVTGPILVFGLERLRPWLESAARRADPAYGRA